jgi:type VI secretion system secreted protein Hcp
MPNIFIKFDGVDGESQQAGFEKWIEINDWNLSAMGAQSSGYGGGSGGGKPTYNPITITTVAGKHSPKLYEMFNRGKHFPTVQVVALKQTGDESAKKYYTCDLKSVFISSMSFMTYTDAGSGSESISITFEEVKQEFFTQDDKGLLTSVGSMTYNNKTNVSS